MWTLNGCEHCKVGELQCHQNSLVFLTHVLTHVSTFRYLRIWYLRICYWLFKLEFWAVWNSACFSVARFYDHKSRHGAMFTQHNATRTKTIGVIIISLNAANASFIVGFIVLVSSHRETIDRKKAVTRHHNMWRSVTFPSHAWDIRPITTHWIAGQSEHASLLRTMSYVKIGVFQKGWA